MTPLVQENSPGFRIDQVYGALAKDEVGDGRSGSREQVHWPGPADELRRPEPHQDDDT